MHTTLCWCSNGLNIWIPRCFSQLMNEDGTAMVNNSPNLCWLVNLHSFQFPCFCLDWESYPRWLSNVPNCYLQSSANTNSFSNFKSAVSSLASCCSFSLCFWFGILSTFHSCDILVVPSLNLDISLILAGFSLGYYFICHTSYVSVCLNLFYLFFIHFFWNSDLYF